MWIELAVERVSRIDKWAMSHEMENNRNGTMKCRNGGPNWAKQRPASLFRVDTPKKGCIEPTNTVTRPESQLESYLVDANVRQQSATNPSRFKFKFLYCIRCSNQPPSQGHLAINYFAMSSKLEFFTGA